VEFSAKTTDIIKLVSPCLVLGVSKAKKPILTKQGKRIDKASQKQISSILSRGDFDADPGSTQILYDVIGIKAERVLILGLGTKQDFTLSVLRSAVESAAKVLRRSSVKGGDLALFDGDTASSEDAYRYARTTIEAIGEALYEYHETKSKKKKPLHLKRISLIVAQDQLAQIEQGIAHGKAITHGIYLVKTLGNLPGNICTPSYLARKAKVMEKTLKIKTTVLNESEMKKKKMGSLLSVSRGSQEPAKLIIMEYKGGKKGDSPIVLIGKGLTFDAGGISLKPAVAMDEMKYDMCGGATVFGAIQAVAEMELNLNVVGIVPASENLPDGAANRPGDVVTSMSGTTIEILNTDAEGRLILCDALTYAERFKPAAVVDIATLTGACVIALGAHASGLFSNDDKLAEEILEAGEISGDRAWRMPVWDDYTKQLKSNFADLANIGSKGAGAVTAACFLKHFAKNFNWAHLDIAGTAWYSGSNKGATGRPVSLLVEFLLAKN